MTATAALAPFDINEIGHYRYRFRDWARQHFPYLPFFRRATAAEREHLAANREALMAAVRQVFQKIRQIYTPEEPLRRYYDDARGNLEAIEQAFAAGDDAQFCNLVDELVGGIDLE